MDGYARAYFETYEGRAAAAKQAAERREYINTLVENALKVDCAYFSDHLDLLPDKQVFFDHLKQIQKQETIDAEKEHEFLSQAGVTVPKDILASHPYLVISKMVDRIAYYYMHDISPSNLSKPATIDTVEYLSKYFPDVIHSKFKNEYKNRLNDEDKNRLKLLYPVVWHKTYPPYTVDFDDTNKDEQGNIIETSVYRYQRFKDALPDEGRLKIINQIFLYNKSLTEEERNYINDEYKSLSGKYPDGKTRIQKLFNSLMGNFDNDGHTLSENAIKEIEDSGMSKTLFDDFISSHNIKDIANAYTDLHHQTYNNIPFIEELKFRILENTNSEILNYLRIRNWDARPNAYLYFYQKEKLNPEQMMKMRCFFARGCYSPEIKDIFYQRGDSLINPEDLGLAINCGVIDDADIEKLNIPSWNKESKYKALSGLLSHYTEAFKAENNIKNRYLQTTVHLLNDIDIDDYTKNHDIIEDIALVACYRKDEIPSFEKIIKQAAKKIRENHYIHYYKYGFLMDELASRGEKLFSAKALISYKKRGIEVDYPENPQLYDFNEKFLCEESYHHSDGSHTTFLNEMLWYKNEKGAVTALNNGANPFIKAGFFQDKFEAMPFNMFFNRELKNNNEAGLKDFMGYIASNINEDKKEVIKDIWNSLGGKLRSDPRVQNIMHNTDKIVRTRFPSKPFDPRVVMALKNGKGR